MAIAGLIRAADPTAEQQYWLELINQMRLDPAGELDRLVNFSSPGVWGDPKSSDPAVVAALNYYGTDAAVLLSQWGSLTAAPALAWNSALNQSATSFSNLMVQMDQQSHTLDGLDLADRIQNGGYTSQFLDVGESLFATTQSVFHGHSAFAIDWGDDDNDPGNGFGTGIQNPASHREVMLDRAFKEIGIGFQTNPIPDTNLFASGPMVVTQHFGSQYRFLEGQYIADAIVTGVVFEDTVLGDNFYTPGEGWADAMIEVWDTFTATLLVSGQTNSAGGFNIVAEGLIAGRTYAIRATETGLDDVLFVANMTVEDYGAPVLVYDNAYARFQVVPEPGSALLFAIATFWMVRRRGNGGSLAKVTALGLILLSPAGVQAEPSLAQRIEERIETYENAVRANTQRIIDATNDEERARYRASVPSAAPYAAEVLEMIESRLGDTETTAGLSWLVGQCGHLPEGARALELLGTRYADRAGIALAVRQLEYRPFDTVKAALEAIATGNPHREEQAAACYTLAVHQYRASEISADPAQAEKARQEAMRLFQRIITEFQEVSLQGLPLADQAAASLFEIAHLSVGAEVPDIEGPDQAGQLLRLSEHRGRHVLLVFWGEWCHGCHGLLPQLTQLATELAGQPFTILGVNTDDATTARKHLVENPLPLRCWLDGSTSGPITLEWRPRHFPTLHLISPDGTLLAKDVTLGTARNLLREKLPQRAP